MSEAVTASATPADPSDSAGAPESKVKRWALHILCVLALRWTPLANGQPFFFFDTTNYIRAADIALHLASGKRISTIWTDRYAGELPSGQPNTDPPAEKPEAAEATPVTHNDISSGLVMSGRSPYIGALMYAGYLTSNFWLFVLFQASLCYFLILLTLRKFGITRASAVTWIVLLLAAITPVSLYNGMLMADAFGAFGILAFLLLLTPGRLSRAEIAVLGGTIVIFVLAHLMHIVMLLGMVGIVILMALVKLTPPVPRRAWIAGMGGIVVGFVALQITAFATEMALGKQPQLLPLLTSRFIADGPGQEYIKSGCHGDRFQICRVHIGNPNNATHILSSADPERGTYILAGPEERRLMGEEDTKFAWTVFWFDPVGQSAAIIKNTFMQLTWIEYRGLNMGCFFAEEDCWTQLPDPVRQTFLASPSGRNAWPMAQMDVMLKIVTAVSLIVVVVYAVLGWRRGGTLSAELRTWLAVTFVAMVVCAGFGGAVVEPQYRYITRMIWLVPLYAVIAVHLYRSASRQGESETVPA